MKQNKQNINGWLIIDKPEGITSAKAVSMVKRLTGAAKVGHTGTLDPFASGVLPMALGEATKLASYLSDNEKAYDFSVIFGASTDTDDREGKIIKTSEVIPSKETLEENIKEFIGEISQMPPDYSAISINGERAYDIARRGEKPELKARKVLIKELKMNAYSGKEASLSVTCGKGMYVRSLAKDLAEKSGSCAYVQTLRRTRVAKFAINEAISLSNLENVVYKGELLNYLRPVEAVLDDIPVLSLDKASSTKLKNGQLLHIDPANENIEGVVCAKSDGKFIALGEVSSGVLKPFRVFNL